MPELIGNAVMTLVMETILSDNRVCQLIKRKQGKLFMVCFVDSKQNYFILSVKIVFLSFTNFS